MSTDPEDILDKIRRIASRYSSIESEGLGPWSDSRECREQKEEAEAFIYGIDISEIQSGLIQAIKSSEDPWPYIEYIFQNYVPTWEIQPYKWFSSILEYEELRKIICQKIPECVDNIRSSKKRDNILNFLIEVEPTSKEKEPIKNLIAYLLKKGEKINPLLISHSLLLSKDQTQLMDELEEYIGPIEYVHSKKGFKIKKVTYGMGSPSKPAYASYTVRKKKVETFVVNSVAIDKIPEILCELTSLKSLSIKFTQITTLPECIGNLSKLEGLYLDGNKLETLPASIGELENLYEIYIRKNNLQSLPEELGNLKKLNKIMLTDNPLTSLPESMIKLSNLRSLYIQNTDLSIKNLTIMKKLPKIGCFAYSCLGGNLQRAGKFEDAVTAFKEVVKENPEYAGSSDLYFLGHNLNSLGRFEEAEKYLQDAVSFKRYKIAALISLGFSYFCQNKLDQAEETFNLALKTDEKKYYRHTISINLGAVCLKQNNFEKAEEMLTEARDLQPENGEAYYNLSCLYALKGEINSSLENLRYAIEYGATLLSGIDSDADFDSIRKNEEFKALVQQFHNR